MGWEAGLELVCNWVFRTGRRLPAPSDARGALVARAILGVATASLLATVLLEGRRVTDADLPWVLGLPSLRTIILRDAPITDAGLEHLQRLPSIRTILLKHTGVTAAGVCALRQRMPGCQIDDSG